MKKINWCYVEEVYIVGFVFCFDFFKNLLEFLDFFFKLLMDDLLYGFIFGYKIFYFL